MEDLMEDLREVGRYLSGLRRYWWLIVGLTALGVIVALIWSAFLPKTYQTSVTILVTAPKLKLQFDSRLSTTIGTGLSGALHRTFLSLARSQAVEQAVLDELGDRVPAQLREPGTLRALVDVSQVRGSSSVYKLKVRSDDPLFAQELANVWATKYIEYINTVYDLSPENKAEIARSLEMAKQRLEEAEEALRSFQATTGMGLVDNIQYPATLYRKTGLTPRQHLFGLYERYGALGQALQAKNNTLGLYIAARDNVKLLLEAATERADSDPATELPLELLAQSDILMEGPLDLERLRQGTVGEARVVLEQEQRRLDDVIERLQADLAKLTDQLSAQNRKLAELVREQALAEESYIILSLKQVETQTKDALSSDSWMQIIDPAALPESPIAPKMVFNAFLGGVLGLLMGVLGAVLLAWWERRPVGSIA